MKNKQEVTSLDFQTSFAITIMKVIDLDFTVINMDVDQDAMFVIITNIVETIQMKIHKSVTVVSEA